MVRYRLPMLRPYLCSTPILLCALLGPMLAHHAAAAPLDRGAKLCLHPIRLPFDEGEEGERRTNFQRKLVEALNAVSLEVASPEAVDELVSRVRTESGGYFDPLTGSRDERRYLAYREQLARALSDELGCDGQLFASVVLLRARLDGTHAYWDGTSIQVVSTARGLLEGGFSGWVGALSLWLDVLDLEGHQVAFRSAGIETLVSLAVIREQDLLPRDRWLTDEARIDAAIASALGINGSGLRGRGRPALPWKIAPSETGGRR